VYLDDLTNPTPSLINTLEHALTSTNDIIMRTTLTNKRYNSLKEY
jgi:hypothetical protein